ncbi:MAG TPA: DUF4838 domain-containing protein, partial [Candidatus Brocadiia bacterium]|nr:DUF4838 domain-containing protein [Candidatus Brocadiia bacterium]
MSEIVIGRGAAVAVVVGADAPPVELWAAEEVGRCLVEALGARLVKPGEGAALTVELVRGGGESYEIEVSRGPARVAVRGASGADLRDGAFAFLEKAVGARWLFPGEEGEWIPRLDELRLRPGRWAGPKGMPYRGLHICGSPHHYDKAVAEWMAHRRCNRKLTHHNEVDVIGGELDRLGLSADTTAHAYSFWVPDAEFYASHPEFFALVGGRRIRQRDGGQLCVSNKELRGVVVERMKAYAAAHPGVAILGLPPNDGYGWCECEACRALDRELSDEPDNVSGRVWDFATDVAERLRRELPGRLVGHYAYSNFRTLPRRPMPENMALSYTVAPRCFRHSLGDASCAVNRAQAEQARMWRSRCQHVYLYEYYLSSSWHDLPFAAWRVAVEDARWMRREGLAGFMTEVTGNGRGWWRASHLAVGAMLGALADPEADAGTMLDDYCAARFGAAGEAMRGYYAALEEGVGRMGGCWTLHDATDLGRALDGAAREACAARLAEAEARATGDERRARAVAAEKALFEKWVEVARRQASLREAGPLTAEPFPGWEEAMRPSAGGAGVELVTRAYLTPPDEGGARLRVYADAGAVYFVMECMEPDMAHLKADCHEDSAAVYNDDSVEIFTAAGPAATVCQHFL